MSDIFKFIGDWVEREGEAELDAAVWEAFGCERTVLVADMAGFTTSTRERGIVHYLRLIQRMRRLGAELLEAHCGRLVRFEADNLFAVFGAPDAALRFSEEFVARCEASNQSQPPESQIHISLGIDHGRILLREDDFFGDAVNMASKLGEDLARSREILVTRAVAEMTADAGFRFNEVGSQEFAGTPERVFELVWGEGVVVE